LAGQADRKQGANLAPDLDCAHTHRPGAPEGFTQLSTGPGTARRTGRTTPGRPTRSSKWARRPTWIWPRRDEALSQRSVVFHSTLSCQEGNTERLILIPIVVKIGVLADTNSRLDGARRRLVDLANPILVIPASAISAAAAAARVGGRLWPFRGVGVVPRRRDSFAISSSPDPRRIARRRSWRRPRAPRSADLSLCCAATKRARQRSNRI